MSATHDVLVLGGGGAGCSAALHLALRGARVALFERGLVGSQASGVNYGGVRQNGRHPAELPIARRAREIWARLPELIGTDAEFEVTGHLKLARSAAEEAELAGYMEVARANDVPLELIGSNSIHARWPWLGPRVVAGAEINERIPVREIAHDGAQFIVTASERTWRAPVALNCMGYWGGEIAARFGEAVPVAPLAPNMLVSEPIPYFIEPNTGVVGGDVYLRQIRRGNVIFGGGRGASDPAIPWSRPLPEPTLAAMTRAVELVPRLAGIQVIRSWTGIDGEMPDGLPVIGPSRTTPGLIHAFGFSGHGFMLGPGIGAILAELVLDGRTDVPLAPFRIERFTLGSAQ